MKFGLNFTPIYPTEMRALAMAADDLGYESLWIGEHVLVPFDGIPDGDRANFRADSRFVEPWVALSHLAAVTTRVRLGTCVSVVPLHSPVHFARAIATADVLSGGRISLGIGVGVIEAEYRAVGEEFHNRGARMDEMLAVMEALFTEDRPEFHGRFYDFPPSGFAPKPVQQPHPPILVGGFGPAAFRRCVEVGDGWFGGSPSPEAAKPIIDDLQRRRTDAGRARLEITLLTGWGAGYDGGIVERYEAIGVDRLVLTPWTSSRAAREGIDAFAEAAGLSRPASTRT
ncbi:MAG: LLM class F420-dependent oxidoreductase [Acidimicrobiia bacterium]